MRWIDRRIVRIALVPLLFWTVSLAAVRYLIVPPEECGAPDPARARGAALAAGQWIAGNQQPDGLYTYLYDAQNDMVPAGYNIVRHAGVTMSLYQLAGRLDQPELLASADLATAWMLDNLLRRADWVALADAQQAPLGGAALMLVALAERRLMTDDRRHDEVMRGLGDFLMAMQKPDGGFYTRWWIEPGERDLIDTSPYFPGEAAWALALLHEALPDERYATAARRAVDYITTERDAKENVTFPPLNDHWGAYAMAEMIDWDEPLSDANIDYARRMAGRFSLFIRFEAQKQYDALGEAIRGGERQASALGTWVEGMAALWRLAAHDERMSDLEDEIRERAACGAGILIRRQAPAERGPLEAGAWFVDDLTRMDDQQHAISGLLYTADALEDRARREPDGAGGSTP